MAQARKTGGLVGTEWAGHGDVYRGASDGIREPI